jgi:hypothetical protein
MAPVAEAGTERSAWIAPRGVGKSTWLFLILPMWAAAHGHKKFAVAFAHSGPQAEQHLSTFRNELDTNELLRADFPDLCRPKLRASGVTVADRDKQTTRANGFTFAARGIDEGVLGMKVEQQRPDLIILDDIEPDEGTYSLYQVGKRLGTLLDAVLPINIRAHVILVGTTTIADGIVHQLVKHALGEDADDAPEWIDAEHFDIRYYPAILTNEDGTESSLWPEKWTLDYLLSIRHTRSFAKNMDNRPVPADGAYWEESDLHDAGETPTTRRLLSLDPATTTKQRSDYTGAAVLGLAPAVRLKDNLGHERVVTPPRVVIEKTWRLKLVGEDLRQWVLAQLAADPAISVVLVETNQGGEHWHTILHDLPARLVTVHQSEPKEVRAGQLLSACQRRLVLLRGRQKAFRDEALAFPNVAHDDVVDAVGSGARRMLGGKRETKSGATSLAYAG